MYWLYSSATASQIQRGLGSYCRACINRIIRPEFGGLLGPRLARSGIEWCRVGTSSALLGIDNKITYSRQRESYSSYDWSELLT
eukprot:scaffold13049_cov89-Cylindrotheca_fusiformis.AAC.1